MRLDVALLPLLSHQLQVKQVMLKGAVIQLTPQSEAAPEKNAPVAPHGNSLPQVESDRGWSWDIARLQVADSLLVFQRANDEPVTVRDIRLQMEQDAQYQATLDFSGRVNRNQRDLTLSFSAKIDARDYPRNVSAAIDKLQWQLQGGDTPPKGISGAGTLQAQWQSAAQRLTLNDVTLSANDSAFTGKGSVTFGTQPVWAVDLQFDKLNLENLLPPEGTLNGDGVMPQGQEQNRLPRPVISSGADTPQYNELRDFTAQIGITAKNLRWRGMEFTDVSGQMFNHNGLLVISERCRAKWGTGKSHCPARWTCAASNLASAEFQPRLENVEIGNILKAFNYPIALTGQPDPGGRFQRPGNRCRSFPPRVAGAVRTSI